MPNGALTVFLAGDVMTGRGIDQALPTPLDPELFEPYVADARRYLELAESVHGPIGAPIPFEAPWGVVLEVLRETRPDARVVNLETSITTERVPWPGKGVHYHMHPANLGVLTAAGVDAVCLANNHVMDFGEGGLRETLDALGAASLRWCGAGLDRTAAEAPARIAAAAGVLAVFAFALADAGVPEAWAAWEGRPGVAYLPDDSFASADHVVEVVRSHRRPGDRVVLSVHWGPNWGYEVPARQRAFAHRLVDAGVADVVFGHSSHHPKGIEVYRGRAIVYGAGDLVNDYEGIGGYEAFRPDLRLAYLPALAADGSLVAFELVPLRMRRFRLERASAEERRWLTRRLTFAGRPLGTEVASSPDGQMSVRW